MATIKIDGEDYEITDVRKTDWRGLFMIETEDGEEFYLAEDSEIAGKAARKYWKDMAMSDPEEFRALVGDESLVKWSLGQFAGPGTTQVRSLEEWYDLHVDVPEEQWAGYDSEERYFTFSESPGATAEIKEEFGITLSENGMAYRWN